MMLTILCACISPTDPPEQVKSWENANTSRPLMVPEPVTTPSHGISCCSMPNWTQR